MVNERIIKNGIEYELVPINKELIGRKKEGTVRGDPSVTLE